MRISFRPNVLLVLLCGIGFSVMPVQGNTATYVIVSEAPEVRVGTEFKIKIGIDTEEDKINLFKVSAILPEGWEFSKSDEQDSVVNIWISQPSFDEKTRTLELVGGVPGGFLGRGVLTTATVRATKAGDYAVKFAPDSEAYLNDGLGTLAPLTFREIKLSVKDREGLRLSNAHLGMLFSGIIVVIGVALILFLRLRSLKRARSIQV